MKIRVDFVTNSSSSSFVIARRTDCTREDIKEIIKNNIIFMQNFIDNEREYNEAFTENSIEEYIEETTDYIFRKSYGVILGDYEVFGGELYDEGLDAYAAFICNASIDTDILKIGSGGY